jgi:DNA-binding transcriptional ArsR family regulator
MKVFATLTALEEAGLVASADQDGSVRYSLTRTGEAELAAQ